MSKLTDSIKEYFDNNSDEQIRKDWNDLAEYDEINSPTIDELYDIYKSDTNLLENLSFAILNAETGELEVLENNSHNPIFNGNKHKKNREKGLTAKWITISFSEKTKQNEKQK